MLVLSTNDEIYRLLFLFNLSFIGDKWATINCTWIFFIFSLFFAKYQNFLMIFQLSLMSSIVFIDLFFEKKQISKKIHTYLCLISE